MESNINNEENDNQNYNLQNQGSDEQEEKSKIKIENQEINDKKIEDKNQNTLKMCSLAIKEEESEKELNELNSDDHNKKNEVIKKRRIKGKNDSKKNKIVKNKKEGKNHKLNNLGGDAFEYMISYNIAQKFFIEDIHTSVENKEDNFNTKQSLDIEEIKRAMIDKLSPIAECNIEDNETKNGYLNEFNDNLIEYFSHQGIYEKISVDSDSMTYSSETLSSESNKIYHSDKNNDTNNNVQNTPSNQYKNKKIKDLTKLEFDLFLKNVLGINYIYRKKSFRKK